MHAETARPSTEVDVMTSMLPTLTAPRMRVGFPPVRLGLIVLLRAAVFPRAATSSCLSGRPHAYDFVSLCLLIRCSARHAHAPNMNTASLRLATDSSLPSKE